MQKNCQDDHAMVSMILEIKVSIEMQTKETAANINQTPFESLTIPNYKCRELLAMQVTK